jgi:hypothetical protein
MLLLHNCLPGHEPNPCRAKVRMLANDVAAAKAGYGPYVEPISADISGGGGLARALRNVRCVIALGRLGKLLPAAQQAGVEHIVLLSTAGERDGHKGGGQICASSLSETEAGLRPRRQASRAAAVAAAAAEPLLCCCQWKTR